MLKKISKMLFLCQLLLASTAFVNGWDTGLNFNETINFFINETNRENIALILRNLSSRPHVGGTPAEWKNAEYIAEIWRKQGLDEVHITPYDVLLSYPNRTKPNYVKLYKNEEEVWKSQGRSKPIFSDEEYSEEVFPDFNAYSATGTVKGDVVFINFGGDDDFRTLESLGINLEGKIAIAKYGKYFRGNIVKAAEDRGAIGVILYPDPQQYAYKGTDDVYPNSIFMPESTAPFGSVYLTDGDPLTPFYPSIESAFRIPEEEAALPKIPVIPIGYDDAFVLLSKLGGAVAPPEWQGFLNITYRVGPGLNETNSYVSLEVHTHNQRTTTYNVIGMMKGIESDRYVVLGNHRDAWIFGAVDPSSASAVMLELTRILTDYKAKTGWTPQRTLVFCSWGSEEYGLIGSQEFSEQFGKQLANRAVAYLNLDMAIEGNYTLRTKSSPLLYKVAREIAKMVPNPDPKEFSEGRKTVFDTWAFRAPEEKRSGYPMFTGLGSGSDYKPFQHNLGIPSMEYRYTHSKEMIGEPLYHTLHETFYLVANLYDQGFHFHAAITQLWGLIAAYISDSKIIPFSLDEYAFFIDDAEEQLFQEYGAIIESKNISLSYFKNASRKFTEATKNFEIVLQNLDTEDTLALRKVNDQLMMVERAFIDPLGLPGRPNYNHVVFAPSINDNYASTAFAGLSDALHGIEKLPLEEQNRRWRTFEEHLATCTHLLNTASKVLSDELW